jgi:hypothetical protein
MVFFRGLPPALSRALNRGMASPSDSSAVSAHTNSRPSVMPSGITRQKHTNSKRIYRPAGEAEALASAAVFRQLPKTGAQNRVLWIHWADLELGSAWGAEAVRRFDELLVKYSAADAPADWYEPRRGALAPFVVDSTEALRAYVQALQALNVPPLLWVEDDDGARHDFVKSTVVAAGGALQVRTMIVGTFTNLWAGVLERQQESFERIGSPPLDHDQSVVWDVLTNTIVSRGSFEHARAYVREQSPALRTRLSWRGRRPWQPFGYSGDDEWAGLEYPQHIAIAIQRERWLERLRRARDAAVVVQRDPWTAVQRRRVLVAETNARIAQSWGLERALLHPGTDPKIVRAFLDAVQKLTETRSLEAFQRAREQFIEDFRTGAGAASSLLSGLHRATATVASVFAEFTGFIMRVLPREWFATPETFIPLPLPLALSGDESATGAPSIAVAAPPGFVRTGRQFEGAPTPMDPEPLFAVVTESRGELAPMAMTELRSTASTSSARVQLLDAPAPRAPVSSEPPSTVAPRRDPTSDLAIVPRAELAPPPARVGTQFVAIERGVPDAPAQPGWTTGEKAAAVGVAVVGVIALVAAVKSST